MTRPGTIVLVDYGVGNLHSLRKAVERFAPEVVVSDDAETIISAKALILPGVGAFQAGMDGLRQRGLVEHIQSASRSGKPILGICLGAQLLLSKGFEFGEWEGLGLIDGEVVRFPELTNKEKIPQIGWNAIYPPAGKTWENTILADTPNQTSMYFVHSYLLKPTRPENVLALATYGGYEFCSAVQTGNTIGCQFHPEKSGERGLAIIGKFISSIKL